MPWLFVGALPISTAPDDPGGAGGPNTTSGGNETGAAVLRKKRECAGARECLWMCKRGSDSSGLAGLGSFSVPLSFSGSGEADG